MQTYELLNRRKYVFNLDTGDSRHFLNVQT